MIKGGAAKGAKTSEPSTKGRAAKHARTSKPIRTAPFLPIDKGKKVVEHLSSASHNKLLNAAKVIAKST